MLGLKLPTDPRWVDLTQKQLSEILTDHAYCEQKAASTSISLIQLYPDKEQLVDELSDVVAEEWMHFKMVLEQIKKRGYKLGRQRKDVYVNELSKRLKKGGSKEEQLLEKLLFAALIEARSCERFKLLSQHLEEEELKIFYKELMISEAGHYKLFLDLAMIYFPKKQVLDRWNELLEEEGVIIEKLALRGDRMH